TRQFFNLFNLFFCHYYSFMLKINVDEYLIVCDFVLMIISSLLSEYLQYKQSFIINFFCVFNNFGFLDIGDEKVLKIISIFLICSFVITPTP
ncbi:hypothetical protein, partial [Herbiconiux daphne]